MQCVLWDKKIVLFNLNNWGRFNGQSIIKIVIIEYLHNEIYFFANMNKITLFFTIILFATGNLFAQKSSNVDLKALDVYYEQMVKDWNVPSASIGIVKDGKLIFAKSYGVKEIGKNEKPDKNTLYAIASNTKAFTSTIIGQLVDEGKLDWNDRVKDYLPYFELYDPWVSNEVTIRDLLSHRVGLGTFSGDVIWYKSDLTAEEILKRAKYIPPAFSFRAGYGYSNLMYLAAGEVIEKVTGKSWGENVKERILDPLKMEQTVIGSKYLKDNYATPHTIEGDKNIPIEWVNWEEIGAMGGLISSVEDMSKWMILNLSNGIVNGDTLISKETRNLVWTPHNNYVVDHTSKNDFNRHFNGYGLGWGIGDYRGNLLVRHGGGFDGMISSLTLIPDQNLGVVVLTNGMKAPTTAATLYTLDQFLGVKNGKDWSKELLDNSGRGNTEDPRIKSIKEKRVLNTNPSLPLEEYAGVYHSDIYGNITVSKQGDQLKLDFEHSPDLSATLKHWHYDVWQIEWDKKHAWFSFGTVKFNTNNNLEVKSMDFDVPNDDIFFEELKPYKVE